MLAWDDQNRREAFYTNRQSSNSHYGPVTPRRVRAPGLHPPQNRPLVGRVPSPGVPIASIMRTAVANLPRQAVDVALMVINLPGQSGIECARQLKALLPKLQIIMLLPE